MTTSPSRCMIEAMPKHLFDDKVYDSDTLTAELRVASLLILLRPL